ncbi:MAG: flagellar motor switch protein FliN [Pseudomonadota bacterium]|uniref:flagellar motor switch protein FliN n=1 Tax=Pseudooceanicola nitratireducens TaxID=517719 RepID=UPI002E9F540A|nr:flagellar motor switch protein FliN [Pseudomonadota bacterium]MEC8668970.1 flagellar motor switch protein FliN [Pseudomonadota bacterium]
MAKEPEKPEETEAAAPPAGETAAAEETVMDAMMSGPKDGAGYNIDAMMNVGLNVQIVLGKTRMPISQLLKLSRGSIIELDKKIGEPVDIVINDRLVARGDLVKLDEDRIGVSLIEIVKDYVSEK